MFRSRSVLVGLLAIILLPSALGCTVASVSADGALPLSQTSSQAHAASAGESNANAVPQAASGPAVTSRAASGVTAVFMTQNGQAVGDAPPQTSEVPHLVLYRNGTLTDPGERTLVVEVTGIEIPPAGVTVTLRVETQRGDPDLRDGSDRRIPAWRESRWIAHSAGSTQAGVQAVFTLQFGETVLSGAEAVATPTDYFRYDITVTDADHATADPLYTFSEDYAFLMENQWIAPLPELQEASDGAAPDELVVHYCDMTPLQRNANDATTRLLRARVPAYVETELGPRMMEAIRVETNDWGFPWHDAWTSFRADADPEQLSVALTDDSTWFHGIAPSKGHAGISIRVNGSDNIHYDTLTDGLMSVFYHELFHNLQRNIHLKSGGDGDIDGSGNAWRFFSEGMAVLASSVGQPNAQFAWEARAYLSDANRFVGGGGFVGALNKSYGRMVPYYAALYWRFLYEQCGGMRDGIEDPAAGMQVINRTLTALYAGNVVDVNASTDLVGAIPEIMGIALEGSSCPFQTYEQSLTGFARAIYALRLDGGRCAEPGGPAGCGFYDPHSLYNEPPFSTIAYAGAEQEYAGAIKGSFGIDFVDVALDPAANGQPLTIEFHPASGSGAEFGVQLWKLMDLGGGARPQRIPSQVVAPEILAATNADGHPIYTIPAVDTTAYNRLDLIITRMDAHESSDPIGEYTIVLHAEVGR